MGRDGRYDAFLSYSGPRDRRLAGAIHRDLRALVRRVDPAAEPTVFWDEKNLMATQQLWDSLGDAVRGSRCFVLLASPAAAESDGVRFEIEQWQEHQDKTAPFLVALTGGEIVTRNRQIDWENTTGLPNLLRGWLTAEPSWVDLRRAWWRPTRGGAYRRAMVRLAAPISGIEARALQREDLRAQRRARHVRIAVLSAFLVISVLATVLVMVQRDEAVQQAGLAEQQRRIATGRALVAEAESRRVSDPRTSLLTGLAAVRIDPTAEARAGLVETLMATHIAGMPAVYGEDLHAFARSADGRVVAAATTAGDVPDSPDQRYRVTLWDTADPARWRLVGTLPEYRSGPPPELALDREGRTLAVAVEETVALWDLAGPGGPRVAGEVRAKGVQALAFSPVRPILAVGAEHAVTTWDVTNRDAPARTAELPDTDGVARLAFAPDGNTMALISGGNYLPPDKGHSGTTLWNVAEPGREPVNLRGHFSADIRAVAFSADQRFLATGSKDGTAVLWDYRDRANPTPLATLRGHESWVVSAAFSQDGRRLVTGGADGRAILWDLGTPRDPPRLATFEGQRAEVRYAHFDDSGATLFTSGNNGRTIRWRVGERARPAAVATVRGHQGNLTGVAVSPVDDRVLATASSDRTAGLWDLTNPGHPRRFAELSHADEVRAVTFSPAGGMLATAGKDGVASLWRVTGRESAVKLGDLPRSDELNDLTFGPDGRTLVTAGGLLGAVGGQVLVWDVTDPAHPVRRSELGRSGGARAVAFGPDGRTVAVGEVGGLRLWDVSDRAAPKELAHLEGAASAQALAFRPDGRVLAVAGARDRRTGLDHIHETSLMLLDLSQPRQPERIGTVAAGVLDDLSFSPDGHTLATAGDVPRLWDVGDPARPALVASLSGHTASVAGVAFGRTGSTLVTAGRDATAMAWNTGDVTGVVARATELACAAAGSGLSRPEWSQLAPGMPYQRLCL